MIPRLALALLAVAAACGDGRIAELEQRLQRLEQQVARQQTEARDRDARLAAELKGHGILFQPAPPADDAEAVGRELEVLSAALVRRLQAGDAAAQQAAMAAVDQSITALRGRLTLALPHLQAAIATAAGPEQGGLVEVFGRLGGAGVVPVLREWLLDAARPAAVRGQAGRSLIALEPAAAPGVVAQLLRSKAPPPDLYLLVHLLGGTGRSDAVPVLIQALQYSDRSVRCHAATALGAYRDEAAVAALVSASTGDEYPAVRTNALRALAKVADPARAAAVKAKVLASEQDAAVRAAAAELPGR